MRTRRGAARAHHHRLLTALCCILLYSAVYGEDMIVQIAADSAGSAAAMVQTLTGQCDYGDGLEDCMCNDPNDPGNPPQQIACKYIFEVVEATTSFVQDVADLDSFTVEEPPMLHIKTNVEWRAPTNDFLITYESLPSDDYKRVLYFQAEDAGLDAGDAGNPCLIDDHAACWAALEDNANYILPVAGNNLPTDKTIQPPADVIAGNAKTGIEVVVANSGDVADSTQTISITVSLASVLSVSGTALGTPGSTTVDGNVIKYHTIGIGMLFWYPTGSTSNMIIFDQFNLVEDSVNTWKVETVNQYTLARYASFQMFQTQAAQEKLREQNGDFGTTERAFELELVVQNGFMLAPGAGISFSYKPAGTSEFTKILQAHQDALQSAVGSRSCFNPKNLNFGVPSPRFVNDQQVITILSAIPDDASVAYNEPGQPAFELSIAMQLCRISSTSPEGSPQCDGSAGAKPLLSLLNFDSGAVPTPVCSAAISQEWSTVEFAQMSVYVIDPDTQKLSVSAECSTADCDAPAPIQLYESGGVTSYNLLSSLMLVAIHPKNEARARDYFDVSNNIAQLDQLYITHQLSSSGADLESITNTPSTNAEGRSTLTLDATLTAGGTDQCHEQIDGFTYTDENCITTHDFDLLGPRARANLAGSGNVNYVHALKYHGSGIVADVLVNQEFSVSNTAGVSFILYCEYSVLTSTDVVITPPDPTTVTYAGQSYFRHFATLTGAGPWTITIDGTSTVITLTHDAALDALVAADIDWLNNYYTDTVQSEMLAFYQDVRAQLVSTDSASLYLVSPTFNWPQTQLIGLRDTSLLSMSWSVSQAAAAPSGARRRLLQVSDVSNSVSEDPDEKQYRRAKSMDELGTACSVYTDTRDFPMTAWRDVLLRSLNCTEAPHICQAVQSCDDLTSPCVHAVTDAARSLRLLENWNFDVAVDPVKNRDNTSNTSNTTIADAEPQYQETPAPYKVVDIDAAVARASATVVIDGEFACQTAVRHKTGSKPPAVLSVPYDNAVPPPLQLEISRPDGNSTCSLEALVQAMAPMQLLHASTHSAIFVAPHIARYMSPIRTQTPVNTQALFAAAHRAHDTSHDSLPSATASAHLRQQRSFFTLPSATLKWLHDRPPVLQDTEHARVALTCGTTTYHEQIDFAKLAHTRRMRVDKKVRRPEVHLQELQE